MSEIAKFLTGTYWYLLGILDATHKIHSSELSLPHVLLYPSELPKGSSDATKCKSSSQKCELNQKKLQFEIVFFFKCTWMVLCATNLWLLFWKLTSTRSHGTCVRPLIISSAYRGNSCQLLLNKSILGFWNKLIF